MKSLPTICISFPPSVNLLYRAVPGRGVMLSAEGRKYYDRVAYEVRAQKAAHKIKSRINLEIVAHMPDKRRRDLDNLLKCTLDALTKAGVWKDDSQIDRITIIRSPDGIVMDDDSAEIFVELGLK